MNKLDFREIVSRAYDAANKNNRYSGPYKFDLADALEREIELAGYRLVRS